MTIREIYNPVTTDLLERGGFQLGIINENQFLGFYVTVTLDFMTRTGLFQTLATLSTVAGQPDYTIPDFMGEPVEVILQGVSLQESSDTDIANSNQDWINKVGLTRYWHQGSDVLKTLSLFPAPQASVANAITIIGTAGLTNPTPVMDGPVEFFPPTFAHFLIYGILAKIFSCDGETKDELRRAYCESRYEEGIQLAQALMEELMEETPNAAAAA